jgi:nitroreductase
MQIREAGPSALRSQSALRAPIRADPIPDDIQREVLDIGRRTGSAKNTQPWQVVVVRDRDPCSRATSQALRCSRGRFLA